MINGVVVPSLTPMSGQSVNLERLGTLVEFLIAKEISAVFVNGTTGEGSLLNLQERRDCADVAIKTAKGRIPVVVQIGAANTRDSLELAVHAADAGADAVACITPSFYAYSDKELTAFYQEIARAIAPLDLYLYNIPARTGNSISAQVAEQLAEESNIVGIKDSSGSMAQILDYLAIPDFTVLPGADLLATQALLAGAKGIVAGPAGIFPEPYIALWNAWQNEDYKALLHWQKVIMQLSRLIAHGGRLDLLKGLMATRLDGVGEVRPPLLAATPHELKNLRKQLRDLLSTTTLNEGAYSWL